MTKSEEISKIDSLIAHLGRESYLGQSIADQREQIIADITSDIMPLQFASLRKLHVEKELQIVQAEIRLNELRIEIEGREAQERRLLNSISKAKDTIRDTASKLFASI